MTIRRRFTLSFLGIMTLFAFNAGVYVWSNGRRSVAVEDLRRAITREALLSSVQLTLNDAQKQIGVLSQVASEAGAAGASPSEKVQFANRLDEAQRNISEFRNLSREGLTIREFENSFRELSKSWRLFYDNFGVNQTKAIAELAIRGDPLSRLVIQELMPRLQSEENRRAESAGENFRAASRISDRITFSIFLISMVVALTAAWLVARDIARGLTALKKGAAAVGAGELGYRISLAQRNELGDLAKAFDDMSGHLSAARQELIAAHQEEKRKGAALATALEELKKAQDRLLVQQKLASLGTLTAGIAHEIKNPLNFVTNFAGILKSLVADLRSSLISQKERVDPAEFEFIEATLNDVEVNAAKIREHGKRADDIVKGMLMHSRGQRGQMQLSNLNSLVSEYVKLAYHGLRAQDIHFNVTIEERYDPGIPLMNVVPHDLSRVILNIANNGGFAADQKAKHAAPGFKPTLSIATRNLDKQVEIRIRDNGNGIPEEIRQKVFEPFFTTKPAGSGTGLGLSMSYEIVVQEHGGQIRVESEPGEYAEFIIILPRT
ncbi:MAG: putative ATPase [Bryobacterales bacterium]|nr:putative ATPase [Bryobacterales bacterium]